MPQNLIFRAGQKAFSIIKNEGLRPDRVKVIAGAAGGPKWLVLSHLDRVIFSDWIGMRTTRNPLFLVGSSIGAWRFAAISQKNPLESMERFRSAYLRQSYPSDPRPQDVSDEIVRIMDGFVDDTGIREILNNPHFRLNILGVRCKGLTGTDKKIPLMLGMAGAALLNALHRKFLGFFFERILFSDPRDIPPFSEMTGFPISRIPLTQENMRKALLASGSIPLVMIGVENIPGAASGLYRDGGIIDYHLDIPFIKNKEEDIALFPHYTDRITPGWLDKSLSWRKPSPSNIENLIMVSPSRGFIERLPYRKIPDRHDFLHFQNQDKERKNYWNEVIQQSKRLGEEFWEATQTGKIREKVVMIDQTSPPEHI